MWLLFACQSDPMPADPLPTDTSAEESTLADTVPEVTTEIPAAALTAESVAATIEGVFAAGMPSPLLPRKAYLEAFDGRDENCPGGWGHNLSGAFQGCTADSGWLYAGVAEYQGSAQPDEISDFSLLADCYMVDPQGNWFVAAGNLLLERAGNSSGGTMVAEISGTYSYAGAGGWMAPAGAGAVLEMEASWTDSGWSLDLDGTVTNGTDSVRLEAISAGSGQCGGIPVGVYGLRGAGGYWYELLAGECGCGMVTYADGTSLGEACVDLSIPLNDLITAMRS